MVTFYGPQRIRSGEYQWLLYGDASNDGYWLQPSLLSMLSIPTLCICVENTRHNQDNSFCNAPLCFMTLAKYIFISHNSNFKFMVTHNQKALGVCLNQEILETSF